ncbi:MAG: phosphotransferase family protein [Gammaproteobacteria bacterium]|nr:MAG: phosphotransferase family protein [Gammaproteobacteria bacterium]
MSRTQPVREGEQLDWSSLDAYLQEAVSGLGGQPDVSQYPAGNSNLTYCLRYPNADLVVRRPPFGSQVKSAHSMSREYRIMKALKPVFTSVPEVLAYSDDEGIIGAEFYVMRRVEGLVAGARALPPEWGFSGDDTRRLCIAFWSKLIELHQVDYIAAGLEDFGRPLGYARRQVEGWNGRMQAAATADGETFEDVQDWLIQNLPQSEPAPAILHGDYRLDNVILDRNDPFRVIALLDWEICALGNPLMDLGNALAYWIEPGDPAYLQALMMQPSSAPGMLRRSEILDLYAEKTAVDVSGFIFYYTYGLFRNTVILQQIYYRFYHGLTQDKRFGKFGALVQALGNHCRKLID